MGELANRWKHRPPGSNGGDCGPHDPLGRPNRHPCVLRPTLRQGRVNFNFRSADRVADRVAERTDVLSDGLAPVGSPATLVATS